MAAKPALVMLREEVAQLLHEATPQFAVDALYPLLMPPKQADQADYAIPVPSIKGRLKFAGDPKEVCDKWIEAAKTRPQLLSSVVLGEGKLSFLNFNVNKGRYAQLVLQAVFDQGLKYGHSEAMKGQKVVIEYSSPNIAKPFHAGHLRSTIIGNVLKQIHLALSAEVIGINYLGDWGKQYGLLALGFEKYGSEEEISKNAFQHLFDLYVKINEDVEKDPAIDEKAREYFKKMEDGEEKSLALWSRFRNISIQEYEKVYKRLNVKFDEYDGEALQQKGMEEAYKLLEEKKLLVDSEGAQIVDLEEYKLGRTVIRNRLGATLYLTRDVSAANNRWNKYHFDKMIYVVAAPQNLHFQQLFKILELMGYEWASKCTHVNFGLVKLPRDEESGKEVNMSTRKGKVVLLDATLNASRDAIHEKMLEDSMGKLTEIKEKFGMDPAALSDLIGLSAVVVQDLSAKRIKDYEFHIERVTSYQGYTGPYLQYSHARLCSMKDMNNQVSLDRSVNFELLKEPEAQGLITQLAKWPETIETAAKTLEPCVIVGYLFDLAHSISLAHGALWIKGQELELQKARMLLFDSARVVLGNGIRTLGLVPVERM